MNQKRRPLAPTSKHEVAEHLARTVSNIVAILTTAALFLTIIGVAAGLGYALNMAALHFHWMPSWMLTLGHIIEAALYVLDCIALLWSVLKHTWLQLSHDH